MSPVLRPREGGQEEAPPPRGVWNSMRVEPGAACLLGGSGTQGPAPPSAALLKENKHAPLTGDKECVSCCLWLLLYRERLILETDY